MYIYLKLCICLIINYVAVGVCFRSNENVCVAVQFRLSDVLSTGRTFKCILTFRVPTNAVFMGHVTTGQFYYINRRISPNGSKQMAQVDSLQYDTSKASGQTARPFSGGTFASLLFCSASRTLTPDSNNKSKILICLDQNFYLSVLPTASKA